MTKYLHYILLFIFVLSMGNVTAQNRYKRNGKKSYKALKITNTTPENRATNISTTPFFSIEFNQDIYKGKGYLYIYNSANKIFAKINIKSNDIEIDDKELIIYIDKELKTDESYYVKIDKRAIKNQHNVYFKGIYNKRSWRFDTYAEHNDNNSINSLFSETPSFYPNPARSTIHLKGQQNVEKIQIINLTGTLVLKTDTKSTSLNITSLPRGMYIISFLQKDGTRISKKLVKQ